MERHKSPTMRLIAHKNSTGEHKEALRAECPTHNKYHLEYTTEPGKSYIIEPEGGTLSYSLARQDPASFIDQVTQ